MNNITDHQAAHLAPGRSGIQRSRTHEPQQDGPNCRYAARFDLDAIATHDEGRYVAATSPIPFPALMGRARNSSAPHPPHRVQIRRTRALHRKQLEVRMSDSTGTAAGARAPAAEV